MCTGDGSNWYAESNIKSGIQKNPILVRFLGKRDLGVCVRERECVWQGVIVMSRLGRMSKSMWAKPSNKRDASREEMPQEMPVGKAFKQTKEMPQ